MSSLLELSSIAKSNDLKDMAVVLFESENEKDLMTANSMNIIAEYLATRVRERDLLIGELDNCLGSTTAYESSKLLRGKNDADLAKASQGGVGVEMEMGWGCAAVVQIEVVGSSEFGRRSPEAAPEDIREEEEDV
uniref:Uncharacterized protein n=1 Tax=Tanacetum cinerariifolium TaxID=118510 RepID=A0A699IES9_TANCI|nr:hypothetical protein [Tanacetum cinerariifolium]